MDGELHALTSGRDGTLGPVVTPSSEPSLLQEQRINITEWTDGPAFVGLLSDANAGLKHQGDESWGFAWWLVLGDNADSPTLGVGVRGAVGALSWWEGDQEFVHEAGFNADHADTYTTTDGHHFAQPPGSEMPIGQVYAAVEELVSTHQRPTSIAWRESR
ncbi:MAG: Imm1 family immunity protein [Haloechinothrix sp.]